MAKRRAIKIEILPTAQADLRDIVDFIAEGSVKYARREKQLIIAAIDKLHDFPELGAEINYRNSNVRQLIYRNYLIIYRFKTYHLIEILTIHHHSRSISNNPAIKSED